MKSIKQWIEENGFSNVFYDDTTTSCEILYYGDLNLLFKSGNNSSFLTTFSVDFIIGHADNTRYESIDETLLSLDKHGLFRNDLKWKMVMTIIKERMT